MSLFFAVIYGLIMMMVGYIIAIVMVIIDDNKFEDKNKE